MTTWTPAEDLNRTAAEQRAGHLMTDERAKAVVAPERPATGVSVTATWTWDSPDGSDIPAERGTQPRIYFFEFTQDGQIHDYRY
jgi:hypothetical protein